MASEAKTTCIRVGSTRRSGRTPVDGRTHLDRRAWPRIRRGLGGWLALFALLATDAALAHGPTVEITQAGLRPALLNLFEGTTVHFTSTLDASPGLVVVIDPEGKIRSPALAKPGDGWHYTFERSGRYAIRVDGRAGATMTIVVVPRTGR